MELYIAKLHNRQCYHRYGDVNQTSRLQQGMISWKITVTF